MENNNVVFQDKDTKIVDETHISQILNAQQEQNYSKSSEKIDIIPKSNNQEDNNSNGNPIEEIQKSNEQKVEDIEFLQVL